MSPRVPLAVLGGAAVALLVFLVLELAPQPAGGGFVPDTRSASASPGAVAPAGGGAAGGDAAAALAVAVAAAASDAGAPAVPVPPEQVRAAPPALVAGRNGELVEVPSGLAGRRATKRGTAVTVPWERVAVVARVSELGKLARPVARGLGQARQQLAPCFQQERQALAAGHEPAFDPADPPTGPAVLILDLETHGGAVQVVSANVESLGTSTPELAGCAVQALTGYGIDAPGAPEGKRFRLMHVLQ